jgi:PPOX class probable F420-dependent enzyme
MPADLDTAKYVSFVTYKKDGSPVATPVWVVPFEGGYAFTTDPNAFKVKRLRHDARATLTVCNMRGAIAEGATVHIGAAVVLNESDAQRVDALIRKKYSIGHRMLGVMSVLKKIAGKGSTAGDAAIKVTLS